MQNEEKNINVDFVPISNDGRIMEGEYVSVADVGEEYTVSARGNTVILKYQAPQFKIGGIPNPADNGGNFYRMDYAKAAEEGGNYYRWHINNNVQNSNWHTSGGTLRFRTDADYINVIIALQRTNMSSKSKSARGIAGIDVYVGTGTDRVYCGKRKQSMVNAPSTVETVYLPKGYKEVLINMPLFGGIKNVTIAFPKDAKIAPPLERTFDKPIVFYGSSITQGASASRPGTAYANMVCRMLDAECRNLGFSEGAHGEDEMITYVAAQDMCAFVMEYDQDATIGQLENSHYKLYEAVRAAHPDIPIVMMTKPMFTVDFDDKAPLYDDEKRLALIKGNYDKALASGDKNVYFINCYEDIFPIRSMADICTGDLCNANDTGMYFMGVALYNKLAPALKA